MAVLRLTKKSLDSLTPAEKSYIAFDSELKGFGVRVMPSGSKSWIIEYRPGGGRRVAKKRLSFGKTSTLTLEQARKAAKDMLSAVRLGDDPLADRTDRRAAATVAELIDAFLDEHADVKRKEATAKQYRDILKRIVRPALGSVKAGELTRAEVAKLHLAKRSTPFTANRMLAIMGSMYSFGSKRGLVPEDYNPASKIERYREASRERFLTIDELSRIGEALREFEFIGIEWEPQDTTKPKSKHAPKRPESRRSILSPHATAALRLLLFTGCRLREILDLKWTHVDFQRGLLLLPDSKSGKKTIVLNGAALAVVTSLPRFGEYVVAGDDPSKPRADLKKPWALISRRAGLSGVRLHDLRHSFASVGAGGGLGLPIIGKLLGHTQAATTQRYAHLDADPLRRASDAIGEAISKAMGAK